MRTSALLTTALAAGTLSAISLMAAPTTAVALDLNQWYTGSFTASNTPLLGSDAFGSHGPVLPNGFGDPLGTSNPPWTFTLTSSGTLTVTDMQVSGDRFELFDNGIAMTPAASPFTAPGQNPGQAAIGDKTSVPVPNVETGMFNINTALGDTNYSSGTFGLHPGVNNITGEFIGVITFGEMEFIAESAIPEPSTWAMMMLGFAGLGFAGYRKARSIRTALSSV